MKESVRLIEDLINNNGMKYIEKNPYKVYETLLNSKKVEKSIAGGIFVFLDSDILNNKEVCLVKEELSKQIQEKCCFNDAMANKIADVFSEVYSKENLDRWKKEEKEHKNLIEFLNEKITFNWIDVVTWDAGNGTVDCFYNAKITIKPTKKVTKDKELLKEMKNNPFIEKNKLKELFTTRAKRFLDEEFEYYCKCDDYYAPVVEDFEIESYLEKWCKENGFNLLSVKGEGHDGGYEPKIRNNWYY